MVGIIKTSNADQVVAFISRMAKGGTPPKQIEHWAKIGEQKKGALAFLRVHKFKMNNQLTLLG